MINVFLDCGTHYGEGLRKFIQSHNIDDNWIVRTFEANPECYITERLSDIKLMNLEINEKAIWIFDGMIKFSQVDHTRSGSQSPRDGKSNIDDWGSVITEINSDQLKSAESPINVECVDFHRILSEYPKEKYKVMVKMDIEGAEFIVLRHIILNNSALNISDLFIEWHHVNLTNEDITTTNKIITELKSLGIKIYNWT